MTTKITIDNVALATALAGLPSGGTAAKTTYTPSDHSMAAWTYDPVIGTGSTLIPTKSLLFGARLYLPTATTISTIWLNLITRGVTLTSTQNKAAIFSSSGTLAGTTTDQSTVWAGAEGMKGMALTASANLTVGYYDVVFWCNGTTAPTFGRAANHSGVNVGQSGQAYRFFTTSDNAVTDTAPATLGTKAASNFAWWVAIS